MFEKTGLGVILEFTGGDEAVAQMGNVQKGVAGMREGFGKVGSGISQIGATMIPAVLGVGAGIAGATWRAAEFEEGILKIGTLLPGGAAEARAFGSEIERMAITTGQSAGVVADGMFQAISAGVKAGESAEFMAVANKSAVSGFTDVQTAVDGLTNLLNAYHLKVSDTMRLSDQMFIANQIGKCIDGDSRVLLADGSYRPIKDLADGAEVLAFDGREYAFKPVRAKWWDQGVKPCYRVTTRSGRSIVTTKEHPYLTPHGWRRVDEIGVGTPIALPQHLPVFGDVDPGLDRAELLGLILGDGSCCDATVRITHGSDRDGSVVGDLVVALAEKIGLSPSRSSSTARAPFVMLSAKRRGGRRDTNPFTEWLSDLNVMGKTARGKVIPRACFTWTRPAVAALLRGLFTTDGWITAKENPAHVTIGYGTVSERLARDVATLLVRFGIHAKIRQRANSHGAHWSVDVLRRGEVQRFLDEIGLGKSHEKIATARVVLARPWRDARDACEDPTAAIRFDPIVAIDPVGDRHVYDLTVPELHNFVAEDVVAHNTTFEELASSIGNVAPTAALAGVQSDELLSAIAAMTLVGIDTSTSVTSINNALLSFINPSKEAKETAKAYGIELNTAALRTKGFLRAITEVDRKIGGNEEALASIFGNIRSFRAAATLATGEGAKVFEDTLQQVRDSAGITDRNFADVSQGIKFKFGQVVQVLDAGAKRVGVAFIDAFGLSGLDPEGFARRLDQIEGAARKFFVGLKGAFTDLADMAGGASSVLAQIGIHFDTLAESTGPEMAGRIVGLAGAFSVVGLAALPLGMAISGVVNVVGGLATAIGALGPLAFTAVSLIADAIGGTLVGALAVAGVAFAGVAVGVTAFVEDAQGFRTALGGLWDVLSQIGSLVGGTVSPILGGLWDIFNGLVNIVAAIVTPAINLLTWVLSGLIGPMGTVKSAGEAIGLVFSGVGDTLTGLADSITELAEAIQKKLVYAWDTVAEKIKQRIQPLIDAVEWILQKLGLMESGAPSLDAVGRTATGWVQNDTNADGGDGWIYDLTDTSDMDRLVLGVSEALSESRQSDAYAVAEAVQKRPVTINNHLNVDGRHMNAATSQYQMEITERAGAKVTPWQRRAIIERGVALRPA